MNINNGDDCRRDGRHLAGGNRMRFLVDDVVALRARDSRLRCVDLVEQIEGERNARRVDAEVFRHSLSAFRMRLPTPTESVAPLKCESPAQSEQLWLATPHS